MYLWLISFCATVASTSGVVVFLKRVCKVARPPHALVTLSDYAFPSGHTSIAWALATFFILFVNGLPIMLAERMVLIFGFVLAASTVAWWRLELRVHTLGQVIAGGMIGVVLALSVYALVHLVW